MAAGAPERVKRQLLTPGQLESARRIYYLFSLLNAFSFNLLGGNIITLFLLRLGASTFLIGVVASFIPLAQVMPLAGRPLVARLGTSRLMAVFWVIRYISMVPVLFAPLLARGGDETTALTLCVVCVLLFQAARGVGITGHNPIIGGLAGQAGRGAFISRLMLISYPGSILVGVAMALLLGRDAPLSVYTVFIASGILFGLGASAVLFRLPELMARSDETRVIPALYRAMGRSDFRRFFFALLFLFFALFMIGPFLILFMKQVYGRADSSIVYLVVVGSVGGILVSLGSELFIDRLGAKPLYTMFTVVVFLVVVPLIMAPPFAGERAFWLYASGIFLFFHFGLVGVQTAGQVYFFGLISGEEHLSLGIVYHVVTGLAAALGALAGGGLLQLLQQSRMRLPAAPFQVYFALVLLLLTAILLLVSRLDRLGARSVGESLLVFFSPRDIRTITLLKKLDRTNSLTQEHRVIRALGGSQSDLSNEDLIQRLGSPRFVIRAEALAALADHPMSRQLEAALIREVRNHHFTTAYMAAEILGRRGVRAGVKPLRAALSSGDFFLSGKAMVALAQIGDRDGLPRIRSIAEKSSNPRVIIHAARAMEILRSTESIPLLLSKLRVRISPFVRDEIILSIAGIVGIGDFFYPKYTAFIRSAAEGTAELRDVLIETRRKKRPCSVGLDRLDELLDQLSKPGFPKAAEELLGRIGTTADGIELGSTWRDALRSRELMDLTRLRFFTASLIVNRACLIPPVQEAIGRV